MIHSPYANTLLPPYHQHKRTALGIWKKPHALIVVSRAFCSVKPKGDYVKVVTVVLPAVGLLVLFTSSRRQLLSFPLLHLNT